MLIGKLTCHPRIVHMYTERDLETNTARITNYHPAPIITKTWIWKIDCWARGFQLLQDVRYVNVLLGLPTIADKGRGSALHRTAQSHSVTFHLAFNQKSRYRVPLWIFMICGSLCDASTYLRIL